METRLAVFLILCAVIGGSAFGQGTQIQKSTVANLPSAASNKNALFMVTDGTGSSDCTVGGGSTPALCISNGSTWAGFSSGSSGVPSTAYTVSVSGGTITASPNASGLATCTGSDMRVVWDCVTAAAPNGGHFYFKAGTYNFNTLDTETATGCNNLLGSGLSVAFAMGFPAVSGIQNGVNWIIEGESAPVWTGEIAATTVNTAGVVFNVTSAAISSVGGSPFIAGMWQRPGINCTLNPQYSASTSNVANDIVVSNVALLFPTNQRGNECQFCFWFANTIAYTGKVVSDFNLSHNAIATGSAPVKGTIGSYGFTSSVSGASNVQYWENTYATGSDICYDWESEHVVAISPTAIYCNTAGEIGLQGTGVFHPLKLIHFVDQENGKGLVFGPQMLQGSIVDVDLLDMEFGNDANWYSTARNKLAKLSETNNGYTSGKITYQVVLAGSGIIAEFPAANLFTSGGVNFQSFEGSTAPNVAILPASDSGTRPNASTWGPAWLQMSSGFTCTSPAAITSNAFTTSGAAINCVYVAQTPGPDQFSKATIGAVDASGLTVTVRGSTSANTYNDYLCTSNAGQTLRKRVAGTFTNLATNATNCAANDVIELRAIGTSYFAYRNGVLSMTATDSSVTSGYPGMVSAASTDTLTNWSGGNVPLSDSARSLASLPGIFAAYYTLSNCANSGGTCGSAASGAVTIAAAATTVTVSTTAVTAKSQILITEDSTLGTNLSVTCNTTTGRTYTVTTRTAGTSFVITASAAPTTNPACLNYTIIN